METTSQQTHHAISINVEKKEIYDCAKSGVLALNIDNLHVCCGPGMEFRRISVIGQLVHLTQVQNKSRGRRMHIPNVRENQRRSKDIK